VFDLGDNAVPLQRCEVVREPQRPVTGLREPSVPFPILLGLEEGSIQFDDQLGGVAAEVCDVRTDRDLAAKMKAVKPAQRAQPGPQPALRRRRVVAQAARQLDVDGATDPARARKFVRVADRAPHP